MGRLALPQVEKGDRTGGTGVIVCYKELGYAKIVLKMLFSDINSVKSRSEKVS